MVNSFVCFFLIIIFCFAVAMLDLVHVVEAIPVNCSQHIEMFSEI